MIINDTNYKDQLLRYFQNNFKKQPKYISSQEENNTYKTIVYKEETSYEYGYGKTKKKSEQDAAKNTLIKLGILN